MCQTQRLNNHMRLCITSLLLILCTSVVAHATTQTGIAPTTRTPDDTQCATAAFAHSLASTVSSVSETDDELTIRKWIYDAFSAPETLRTVLACPEIASVADDETITFLPIEYTFPGGRQIIVNYETQPKILKQRITISEKRELPYDPNPEIGADGDTSVWTNTDPAWYAIMVVEHGALDEFVGPDKNNTISLQWVNDNIDTIYPHSNSCTSKTALAGDNDMVNLAGKATVNLDDDTNDYYVAGDANLQWISYLEIGLDVVITVATAGGGAAVLGVTKAARASRALKNIGTSLRALRQTDAVRDYIRVSAQYSRATEELRTIDRATDAAAHAAKSAEIDNLARQMRNMEQTNDQVRQYREYSDTFSSLNQYRRTLRGVLRPAQRGNIIARAWRSLRAANTGGPMIKSAARLGRSSMKSGKIRDWLFQTTLQNIGAVAKLEQAGGLLYGALNFVGGMYDWTETSTGEYTSGIEFKPLTLLSADDLSGQENVVNYGMWLMWMGDSISAMDDDAAYLQAMDFADKFHYNLMTVQSETPTPCNIDIYVVRPIIRNPGGDAPEMYYLVMNDEPWTTANTGE